MHELFDHTQVPVMHCPPQASVTAAITPLQQPVAQGLPQCKPHLLCIWKAGLATETEEQGRLILEPVVLWVVAEIVVIGWWPCH